MDLRDQDITKSSYQKQRHFRGGKKENWILGNAEAAKQPALSQGIPVALSLHGDDEAFRISALVKGRLGILILWATVRIGIISEEKGNLLLFRHAHRHGYGSLHRSENMKNARG